MEVEGLGVDSEFVASAEDCLKVIFTVAESFQQHLTRKIDVVYLLFTSVLGQIVVQNHVTPHLSAVVEAYVVLLALKRPSVAAG